MHLGYHELRNMLSKFKEERDKRKMGPPSTVPSTAPAGAGGGIPAPGGPPPRGGERDFRDRDRGYDRHSARYEYVDLPFTAR